MPLVGGAEGDEPRGGPMVVKENIVLDAREAVPEALVREF